MAINFKSFMNDIKSSVKGAGETVKNYAKVGKQYAQRQEMQSELARKKKRNKKTKYRKDAQTAFKKQFGRSYNPANESRKDNMAYKSLMNEYKSK